jgi:hypothetical protein
LSNSIVCCTTSKADWTSTVDNITGIDFSHLDSVISKLAIHLGDIYVGTPTCADDLALLSSSEDETQLMLNVVHRYSQQHFYNLHPTKTNIE